MQVKSIRIELFFVKYHHFVNIVTLIFINHFYWSILDSSLESSSDYFYRYVLHTDTVFIYKLLFLIKNIFFIFFLSRHLNKSLIIFQLFLTMWYYTRVHVSLP